MKFLYFLVSAEDGSVTGTNNQEQAKFYFDTGDYTVIYNQTGATMNFDNGKVEDIVEAVEIDESGCEVEEDEDGDLDE